MTLLDRTRDVTGPALRAGTGARPGRGVPWGPVAAALLLGAVGGVLTGLGSPLALLLVLGPALLVGLLAQRRHGYLLPLAAVAAAATPALVVLPLMVTVGGKSLYVSDLLLPLAALVALTTTSRLPRHDVVVWVYTGIIGLQAVAGIAHRQPFNAFTQDLRGPVYLILGYFVASRLYSAARARPALLTTGLVLWYSAAFMVATIVTGVDFLSGRSEEVRAYQAGGAVAVEAVRFILNSKGLAFVALVASTAVLLSRDAGRRTRLTAAALAVPAFLITFLAYARATLLALAVCALLLLLVRHGVAWHRRRAASTALVVLGLVGLVVLSGTASSLSDPEGGIVARQVAGFEERVIGGLGEDAADSPGNRYRLAENGYALEAWARSPLVGHGIGAEFKPATFDDPALRAFQDNTGFGTRFLHNGWLWFLVKTGAVGTLAFALVLFLPVVRVLRRERVPGSTRAADVGLAVSVVGLAVVHVFEPDLNRVGTAPVAGVVLGYLALRAGGVLRRETRTTEPSEEART